MNPLHIPLAEPHLGVHTVRARTWAQITVYLLAGGALLRAIATYFLFEYWRAVSPTVAVSGSAVARLLPLGNSYDTWARLAIWVQLLGIGVTMVWVYHAHKALPEIGVEEPEISPGWAAISWIVPVATLWMPIATLQHLWRASSAPPDAESLGAWKDAPRTPVAVIWWLCMLAAGISGRMFSSQISRATTLEQVHSSTGLGLVSGLLVLTGLSLCTWLVLKIAHRQLGRARVVSEFAAPRP